MTLKEAVLLQLDASNDEINSIMQDVQIGGAAGGVQNFIYYSDTVNFFKKHRALIIEHLRDYCDEDSIIPEIRGWNGVDASEEEVAKTLFTNEIDTQIANVLAWYALESVAAEWECADEE